MYMAQTGSMCWNPLSLFQHIHLVGATPPGAYTSELAYLSIKTVRN